MSLASYSALIASIQDWLDRDDLLGQSADFVRLLEAGLMRDEDVRRRVSVTLIADGEELALPEDFKIPHDLYHNGPTFYGSLDIMAPADLAAIKLQHGTTGPPRAAAFLADMESPEVWLAPVPDASYNLTLVYDQGITHLADELSGYNWLLLAHPDIYLFGSLLQAESFLENDERLPTWQSKYDMALAQLRRLHVKQDGGANTLRRRTRRVIG